MDIPREYVAALQEAQNRVKRSDGAGALHIGAQLLRVMPKHPDVHLVMARAFVLEDDMEQALARFRAATELVPKEPGVWTEFVAALLRDGQKGRARKVAQKAPLKGPAKKALLDLAKKGVLPSSRPTLGGASLDDIRRLQTLIQSGSAGEALEQAKGLLETYKQSAAVFNLAGVAALALEEFEAAAGYFRKTSEISPGFVGAKVNLGLSQVRQRDFLGAKASFLDALTLDPTSADARKNLALAGADLHDPALVVEHARRFLDKNGDDVDLLKALATALASVRRFDEAFDVIDRLEAAAGPTEESRQLRLATLIDADRIAEAEAFASAHVEANPDLRLETARLEAQLGGFDRARADLQRLIDEKPDEIAAYAAYGTYAKWTVDDPVLPKLRAAVDRVAPGSKEEATAYYALSKAQFDLGEDDAAFAALHRANAGQRFTFDAEEDARIREAVLAQWSKETIADLAATGDRGFEPIFIIGVPRSGSTLLDNVIAAHPSVRSLGEDSIVAPIFPVDMPAKKNVVAKAVERSLEACAAVGGLELRLLDKLLHNFLRVGALASAFPGARFVHTSRDPRAIALSIYRNEFRSTHGYSASLENIGRFFNSYVHYMQHWEKVLGDRLITSRYESVVADPEPEIRALIDRLGLEWDDACLKPEAVQKRVKTLSVAQVRSGINTVSSELWRRYEDELAPFTEIASDVWDFEAGRAKDAI